MLPATYPTPPPPIRPGAPAESKKRGAPIGNTNALKHGYYATAFRAVEQADLTDYDPASLENEIQLLRVFLRRTAVQAEKVANLDQSLILLNVMSRAALSLGSLMRTQRLAVISRAHEEFELITAQCRAEFARANALTARLETQLTELETSRVAAAHDPANPLFRYPTVEPAPLASLVELPPDLPAADPQPLPAPPQQMDPPAPALLAPIADQPQGETTPLPSAAPSADSPAPQDESLAEHDDLEDDDDLEEEEDDDDDDDDLEYCHPPLDCLDCDERPGCPLCPPNLLPDLAPHSYSQYR